MKIAVLSGKGGTGKTFCAVNLAASQEHSTYVDCDVEEPNGHLFLKPESLVTTDVNVLYPMVDTEKCDGCRQCADFCKFNAIAVIQNKIKIFGDVCHSCGGCALVCPQNAITDIPKKIGTVIQGNARTNTVITGTLEIGEETGVPIIKNIESMLTSMDGLIFVDCAPGTSCAAVESVQNADFCLLVAEPTIFGAHNLDMIYNLVKMLQKPCGVVLNKSIGDYNPSLDYCMENNIPIMGEIKFDKELGKLNSEALVAVWEDEKYQVIFDDIFKNIIKEAKHETIANS